MYKIHLRANIFRKHFDRTFIIYPYTYNNVIIRKYFTEVNITMNVPFAKAENQTRRPYIHNFQFYQIYESILTGVNCFREDMNLLFNIIFLSSLIEWRKLCFLYMCIINMTTPSNIAVKFVKKDFCLCFTKILSPKIQAKTRFIYILNLVPSNFYVFFPYLQGQTMGN